MPSSTGKETVEELFVHKKQDPFNKKCKICYKEERDRELLSISFCSRGFAFCAVGKLYNSTNSKLQAVGLSGSSILCVKHVLHTNDFSQMIKSFSHVVVQSNKLSVVSR